MFEKPGGPWWIRRQVLAPEDARPDLRKFNGRAPIAMAKDELARVRFPTVLENGGGAFQTKIIAKLNAPRGANGATISKDFPCDIGVGSGNRHD